MVNPSKKLVLKWLIETHNPSFIYLQELMTSDGKVTHELSKLLKGWAFCFVDAIG
jgi:hypothetical protein